MQATIRTTVGESASIACERCRKRKIKCDRQNPCSKCIRARADCVFPTGGERSRPATKHYVQALGGRIASLEAFIQKLASVDDAERPKLLDRFLASTSLSRTVDEASKTTSVSPPESGNLVLARIREGHLRKLPTRNASQFYGGSSLFQFQRFDQSKQQSAGPSSTRENTAMGSDLITNEPWTSCPRPDSGGFNGIETLLTSQGISSSLPFSPRDKTCRDLMSIFFKQVYPYNMCIYREFFLRDYHNGGGPYYSDMLMYTICAVGALVSETEDHRALSPVFAQYAGAYVFNSLEAPDLTTLQALVVLGHYEVGQGRSSKGWLLFGMACRLTHEMGLHLDPNNWSGNGHKRNSKFDADNSAGNSAGNDDQSGSFSVDREILRRVYWAVFIADKQLSLYFGRPPALYPHEADVRGTIRIPYPPEWEMLYEEYICEGDCASAIEDALAFIGTFTHHVDLAKIFHTMIVNVFENRTHQSDPTTAAAVAHQVHTALIGWLSKLPSKLHWNQWIIGQVPSYVLHLHLLFHTAIIILHRPPKQHLEDQAVAGGESIEMCYQSLSTILRLLKSFGRYYRFQTLPLDFVYTLSAAADVVIMKRYIEQSSWEDSHISKPLTQILETMNAIKSVFPCVREIRDGIDEIIQADAESRRRGAEPDNRGADLSLLDLLRSSIDLLPGSWGPEGGSTNDYDMLSLESPLT